MNRITPLGLAVALALAAAACGPKDAPEPQNEATGAMMPDTDSVANTGATTAPDAAATGTVPLNEAPADAMGGGANNAAGATP